MALVSLRSLALGSLQRSFNTTAVRARGPGATHGDEGWIRWRKITILVGVPAIILGHVNAFWPSEEDKAHRPEFVAYEYLRIRKKAFPWGDGTKSLIHNPHTNALPDGYEEDGH